MLHVIQLLFFVRSIWYELSGPLLLPVLLNMHIQPLNPLQYDVHKWFQSVNGRPCATHFLTLSVFGVIQSLKAGDFTLWIFAQFRYQEGQSR